MVRIFVSSRRPCDSEALATSSYDTTLAQPLSAATFVSAAVRVVLPWSMCPMVPTFTCGLLRSNFSLAMSNDPRRLSKIRGAHPSLVAGADDQNRTGDLVLTKDALCQLSYIGLVSHQTHAIRRRLRPEAWVADGPRLRSRHTHHPAHPAGAGAQPQAGEGWSGRRGSNPRPTAWKAVTLPLSYSRLVPSDHPSDHSTSRRFRQPCAPFSGATAFTCCRVTRLAEALDMSGERWLVAREGLEPSKPLGRQIYSLLRLTASLPRQLSVFGDRARALRTGSNPRLWSWRRESNPRPAHYKSAALPD